MSATIAVQMARADFLKLRKRRSIVIWALVLVFAPIVIYFAVTAIQHASDPSNHGPAGGLHNFRELLPLLGGLFFGPLAAILIGVEAGTSDASAGVFRDLVVTGRSRVALFASRVPAALALCWTVIGSAYLLILLGTFVFASNLATPNAALILNSLGFLLLATGVLCAVAVGFASLTTSKPAAIIALIAWQVVASPLLCEHQLARERPQFHPDSGTWPLQPGGPRRRGATAGRRIITMGGGTALLVIVVWLVVFLGLGAWRTRTMDV